MRKTSRNRSRRNKKEKVELFSSKESQSLYDFMKESGQGPGVMLFFVALMIFLHWTGLLDKM